MISALATGLIIAALAVAAWALGLMLLNRPPSSAITLGLLALLELALLVQLVIGIAKLASTDKVVSGVAFLGYQIGALLILPVATFWALAERKSRWGSGVLIIAGLVIPVMIVRMNQIWDAAGA